MRAVLGCPRGTRSRSVKEIGLMCSGRTKVCHQDNMLFNCAVQVPHRALRTRPLCIPLLVVRPAVYCYVSRPRKRGVGGAEEARTPDPLLAKEVLSQLSYGPVLGYWSLEIGDWTAVFPSNVQPQTTKSGGAFWTRTRDLSLIRTAL